MKWLLGAIMLLVLGLVFRLGLLVYGMYVLLGVLLVSRALASNWTGHLTATRSCDQDSVGIGESVSVQVSVLNLGRLSVPWVLIEDALPFQALRQHPPRLRVKGPALSLARIRGGAQATLTYEVEFLMRGYYQFGPLLLESGDLFGLHRKYRVVTAPHYVLVYPKVVALEGYDIASRRPMGEVRISHRLFEDPTRIAGVRPYEKGDSLNRIHWRATARTGVLHSKVYEPSCIAGATLVLDFHSGSFPPNHALATTELAITTAASLANALYLMGEQLGLVTNGRDAAERVRYEGWRQEFRTRSVARAEANARQRSHRLQPLVVETQRGPSQLDRILRTLARLELSDGFDLPQLLLESGGRLPRDASVIAILGSVSDEAAIALGNLRRSGYIVTAVLVMFGLEHEYFDWAEPPEWASRLVAERITFRRVDDEASLSRLCAEGILR
jgi:uncharacterized protein (DUF58 family)